MYTWALNILGKPDEGERTPNFINSAMIFSNIYTSIICDIHGCDRMPGKFV